MDVVSACVHDPDVLALSIRRSEGRGIVESGFLFNGERVHVGANEETGTGAVLEDGDDAVCLGAVFVFPDVLGDGVAELAEFCGEKGGCLHFVVGELWVAVELLVGLCEGGELFVDRGGEIGGGLGGG